MSAMPGRCRRQWTGAWSASPASTFSSTTGEGARADAMRQLETGGVPVDTPAQLALFLASPASDGLTGRLISSIHDDWARLAGRGPEISKTEWYTLRRVKPE